MKRRLARILCVMAFAAPAAVLGYGENEYQSVHVTTMSPVIAWRLGGSSPVKVNNVKDMDFRWKAVLKGCYVAKADVGKSFVVPARTNLTNDGDDGDKNGTATVRATLVSNGIEYQIVSGSVKTSGYYNTLNVQPDSIGEFRAICNQSDPYPASWWIFNKIYYEAVPLHQQGSVAQMWVRGEGWRPIESAQPQFSRNHGSAYSEDEKPFWVINTFRVTLSRSEPRKKIVTIYTYDSTNSPNAVLTAYWNDADFQISIGRDENDLVPLTPGVAAKLSHHDVYAVLRAGAQPGRRSENVRLVFTVP